MNIEEEIGSGPEWNEYMQEVNRILGPQRAKEWFQTPDEDIPPRIDRPLRVGSFDFKAEMANRKNPLVEGDGRMMMVLEFEGHQFLPHINLGNFSEEFIGSQEFENGIKGVADKLPKIRDLAEQYWPDLLPALVKRWKVGDGESLVAFVINNPSFARHLINNPAAAEEFVSEYRSSRAREVKEESFSRLHDLYGARAYENNKGELSKINESWWGGYFAAMFESILFEATEKKFYAYEGSTGLFGPLTEDSITTQIATLILDSSRQWEEPKWAGLERFRSANTIQGIIRHLRGQIEERDAFKHLEKIMHLENCVLRFDKDRKDFIKEEFAPKFRSRNQSPISYDPTAKCPKFKEMILGHLADYDQEILQKYAGQCLLGENLIQRMCILGGEGGASKGAFVKIIRGIIGSRNTHELRTEQLDGRFEIGRMIGSTLLIGADVKSNFLSGDGASRLKSLVGGDPLKGEPKGSNESLDIDGNFNVLISSNSPLKIRLDGDTSAWKRRLLIVQYDKPYFGKTIPNIDAMLLREEGAGILNWCIKGALELLRDIEETGTIRMCEDQKNRVETLLAESDSLHLFIKEEIVLDKYSDLSVDEIIHDYSKFCQERGWDNFGNREIQRRLPDLMLKQFSKAKSNSIPKDGKHVRGFHGVAFISGR